MEKKAKGKYIAFIDSDDFWKPNKLKKQIEFIESNKYKFIFENKCTCSRNRRGFSLFFCFFQHFLLKHNIIHNLTEDKICGPGSLWQHKNLELQKLMWKKLLV